MNFNVFSLSLCSFFISPLRHGAQQLCGGRDGLLGHGAGRGAEEISGPHSCPGRSPEGGTSYRGLQVIKKSKNCCESLGLSRSILAGILNGVLPFFTEIHSTLLPRLSSFTMTSTSSKIARVTFIHLTVRIVDSFLLFTF